MTLTLEQMLTHWRRALGLGADGNPASVEVVEDAVTTDSLVTGMRRWYLDLLDNAPLKHLCTTDVTDSARLEQDSDGLNVLTLPANVRRVVSLTVNGRRRCPDKDESRRMMLHTFVANPYARRAPDNAAVMATDRPDTLEIFCTGKPVVSKIIAVADPGDELFSFDESALSLLPCPDSTGQSFFDM